MSFNGARIVGKISDNVASMSTVNNELQDINISYHRLQPVSARKHDIHTDASPTQLAQTASIINKSRDDNNYSTRPGIQARSIAPYESRNTS